MSDVHAHARDQHSAHHGEPAVCQWEHTECGVTLDCDDHALPGSTYCEDHQPEATKEPHA